MRVSQPVVYQGPFPWACRNCEGAVKAGQRAFRVEAGGFLFLSHLNLDDHVFADWRAHAPEWLKDLLR
jgi:hypothetical protein